MSDRELKQHLIEAWRATITQAYAGQMVQGERGLLAQFCHQLQTGFQAQGEPLRLYVDPQFMGPGGRLRVPDLAICFAGQVIGVVTLHYQPRQAPEVEKALSTLRGFAALAGRPLLLAQERYLGPGEELARQYTVAPDAVCCWAGIYRGPQRRPVEQQAADLGDTFLALHAVTTSRKPPALHEVAGAPRKRGAALTAPPEAEPGAAAVEEATATEPTH